MKVLLSKTACYHLNAHDTKSLLEVVPGLQGLIRCDDDAVVPTLSGELEEREGQVGCNGEILRSRTWNNVPILHKTAAAGFIPLLKVLLCQASVEHLETLDDRGQTAFFVACKRGQQEAALRILQRSIDQNCLVSMWKCSHVAGHHAIHWATYHRMKDVIRELGNHKKEIDIDIVTDDDEAYTALHLAVRQGWQQGVRVLLEQCDAHVDKRDAHGDTALMGAAQTQQTNLIRLLVEKHFADVDCRNNDGDTALHMAYRWAPSLPNEGDTPSIAQLLLDLGASSDIRNASGRTPESTSPVDTEAPHSKREIESRLTLCSFTTEKVSQLNEWLAAHDVAHLVPLFEKHAPYIDLETLICYTDMSLDALPQDDGLSQDEDEPGKAISPEDRQIVHWAVFDSIENGGIDLEPNDDSMAVGTVHTLSDSDSSTSSYDSDVESSLLKDDILTKVEMDWVKGRKNRLRKRFRKQIRNQRRQCDCFGWLIFIVPISLLVVLGVYNASKGIKSFLDWLHPCDPRMLDPKRHDAFHDFYGVPLEDL